MNSMGASLAAVVCVAVVTSYVTAPTSAETWLPGQQLTRAVEVLTNGQILGVASGATRALIPAPVAPVANPSNGTGQQQQQVQCSTDLLIGCKYKIKAGDTLLSVAGSLDVEMDVLQSFNALEDMTANDFFSSRVGATINIPCPGSTYLRFLPVYVAGCFFQWTVTPDHPTLLTIVTDPIKEVGGPFTLKGVWTANFQSQGVDLTQPGEYYVGRTIYLPTCGHAGILSRSQLDSFPTSTGCSFQAPTKGSSPLLGSDSCPLTVSELARLLQTSVNALQELNPGLNLKGDTRIATGASRGLNTADNEDGDNAVNSLAIQCPKKP